MSMNKEVVRNFAIDDIKLVSKNSDTVDFAVAQLWFLAAGDNSHKTFITEEVLQRDAISILGKPVVAAYNCAIKDYATDVGTHEKDRMEIVGYVPPNAQLDFKKKNGKLFAVVDAVISKLYATRFYQIFQADNLRSVSVEMTCSEHERENEEGTIVDRFCVHATTALGKNYNPSVKGAEMSIVKFSESEAENFYNKNNKSVLQKFSDERKNLNQDLVEKKLGLETEEKQMEKEKKEFESEVELSEVVEETVVELADTTAELGCHSESLELEEDADGEKEEEDKEEKEELAEVKEEDMAKETEEMAKEEVDEEDKTEKFSYDVNADVGAFNELLSRETESFKDLTDKAQSLWQGADMNIIMEEFISVSKELAELKEYKAEVLKKELSADVTKVLSIVKENVTDEEYQHLYSEGMDFTADTLNVFENKIKAMAFDKGATNKVTASKHIVVRQYDDVFANMLTKDDVNSIYEKNLK